MNIPEIRFSPANQVTDPGFLQYGRSSHAQPWSNPET